VSGGVDTKDQQKIATNNLNDCEQLFDYEQVAMEDNMVIQNALDIDSKESYLNCSIEKENSKQVAIATTIYSVEKYYPGNLLFRNYNNNNRYNESLNNKSNVRSHLKLLQENSHSNAPILSLNSRNLRSASPPWRMPTSC